MKFVGIIAMSAYTVQASLKSLNKGQKQFVQVMGGNNRNLMLESVNTLAEYGCWCFFDDQIPLIGNGKGLPRDFIDTECRDMHRAYECAYLEIQGCEPWKVSPMTHGSQSFNQPGVDGDIKKACEVANQFLPLLNNGIALRACAIAACAAETKFLQNVNTYLLTEDANYAELTHVGKNQPNGQPGQFNHDRQCVAECPKGECYSDKDPRQCCGEFPERYPFKVHEDDVLHQKCCGKDWTQFQSGQVFINKPELGGTPIFGTETYVDATHTCVNDKVVPRF